MLMIIFLVLQQTSFLSNPTNKARVSLMELKVMAVTEDVLVGVGVLP